ncbi:DUF397 domain-containing protein [Streptomyces sp. NPDC051105]|uniref:DUF397 domain-containing protein n=1 Tax=Streptomyces sp. NPDC051105 TaxID=3154843 RepID=UPI00341EF896
MWTESSYSDGHGGNCLGLVPKFTSVVPVRDSKSPDGPVLFLGRAVARSSSRGARPPARRRTGRARRQRGWRQEGSAALRRWGVRPLAVFQRALTAAQVKALL